MKESGFGRAEKKLAMLLRWTTILFGKTTVAIPQGRGKVCIKGELLGYWNDLTGKVSANTPLDGEGIPVSVIAGGVSQHLPVPIFQYALGCYDSWLLTGNEDLLASFESCVRWSLDNQLEDGSWLAFGSVDASRYKASSMVQGEGASVLARAYSIAGDRTLLEAAQHALDFMLTPTSSGGTAVYENGGLYLEEYPQNPRRSVLNGWVFSLFGLYDMSLLDEQYGDQFLASSRTLASELERYDTSYWSLYDLEGRLASPAYHDLHIALLDTMYELTGLEAFSMMALRFCGYRKSKINAVRAITIKVVQKLAEEPDVIILK